MDVTKREIIRRKRHVGHPDSPVAESSRDVLHVRSHTAGIVIAPIGRRLWTRNVCNDDDVPCLCRTYLLHFHLAIRLYCLVCFAGSEGIANEFFENEVQMDAVVFGPVSSVHR